VEGAGSEVVGAHDVDAELGALTGCSKRGRSGGPWWLDNGKHGGAVASKRRRKKKGRSTGGCSFYSRWRQLAKAARATGGAVVAVKPWAWQSGGGRSPNMVGTIVRTGRLMGEPQRFQIFPIYLKPAQL
jgi:hypothetical protein